MLENYAWGIRWQWGNTNHPPLFGWITAAWFEVFPRTHVAYRLLASTNIVVSLSIMLFIASRFLDADQLSAAVAAALALPLLGFMSLTYNANSAMLPFWAGLFLFYLRILERPTILNALGLGLLAGMAMLVKYHSAVILLALLIHAIFDARARPLWRTASPWIAAVAFALVVLPHALWLIENSFSTIRYAALDQGENDTVTLLRSQFDFLLAQLAYTLPGVAVLGLYRRPGDGLPRLDTQQFGTLFGSPTGRALLAAALLPFPLTMVLGLSLSVPLTSNWSVPFFVFMPILLVMLLPKPAVERRRWTGLAFVLGFSALLIALSPIIRAVTFAEARQNSVLPIREIVRASEEHWRENIGTELAYVGGDPALSYGASFYAASRPFSVKGTDLETRGWIDSSDLVEKGYMILCIWRGCVEAAGEAREALLSTEIVVPAIEGAGGPADYRISVFIRPPAGLD